MNRRTLVAKGGASAFALTLAGLAANRVANAQDSTPEPSTSTDTGNSTEGSTETRESASATKYQEFVTALASNLGITDASTVDTAIRTTLKGFVDAELASGDLAANDATTMKDAIDESSAPIRFGSFGHHKDMGGMRGGRSQRGNSSGNRSQGGSKPGNDSQGSNDGTSTSGVEATPTTTT